MHKIIFALILFTSALSAQEIELDSIKGKMEPQADYSYVILYKIVGANQVYIANTKVTNGAFSFAFPKNSEKGFYRLYYDIENKGYADVIYNNENIEISFDPLNPFETKKIAVSEENIIYENYLSEIGNQHQKLDSLQLVYFNLTDEKKQRKTAKRYAALQKKLTTTQSDYETKSIGKLANNYIKANTKFYSETILETPQLYLNSIQNHFFDYINFNEDALKKSPILVTKAIEYIFYLNGSEDAEVQEQLYRKGLADVMERVDGNAFIKSELLKTIIQSFANQENVALVDTSINDYYSKQPFEYQSYKFLDQIKDKMKLAIGKKAPEITWQEDGETKQLSKLDIADYYVLAFWSTSCSHCLKEIPVLHEKSKPLENIKVIAIALEDMRITHDAKIKELPNFINILALGKWENENAKAYKVMATPTYFILDKEKTIIAKPEYIGQVNSYIEKLKAEPILVEEKPELTIEKNVETQVESIKTHIVEKGNTLYSISRQYGIKVDELKKLNNLGSNSIKVGQILKLTNE